MKMWLTEKRRRTLMAAAKTICWQRRKKAHHRLSRCSMALRVSVLAAAAKK